VVLDVACGCGGFTYQLARRFHDAQVVGIDIDEAAISVANETYGELAANLRFVVLDAYRLAERYDDVDLVTIVDSLHHFDDLQALLSQVSDSLKTGGHLFFEDFDRTEIYQHFEEKTVRAVCDLRSKYSDKECLAILSQSGSLNMQLLMLLSFMAAYTPSEIRRALKRRRFEGDVGEPARGMYVGLVTKK